jgi:hypothetical protein
MARDAIARQFDVDKNRVNLLCETDKGGYRPGKISFVAKKGHSVDLRKMQESITATRLSGGTNMSVDYLDITATGSVVIDADTARFKVANSKQEFILKDAAGATGDATPLRRLRAAVASGADVVRVEGRVDGWTGRFPVVLQALAKLPPEAPMVLYVSDFATKKE